MRKQLVNAACRLSRQALKDVPQVRVGIMPIQARRVNLPVASARFGCANIVEIPIEADVACSGFLWTLARAAHGVYARCSRPWRSAPAAGRFRPLRRANRVKVRAHDGIGVWPAARRTRQIRLTQG